MADESNITFRVNADDQDAQKKLESLRKDIEKTAKALDKTNTQHNGLVTALEAAKTKAAETQAEVDRVQQAIFDTQREINNKRFPGGQAMIPPDVYADLTDKKQELLDIQRTLQDQLASEKSEVDKISRQEEKVRATLEQQTKQLEQQKVEAGQVEIAVARQASEAMPQVEEEAEAMNSAVRGGVKSILKWGIALKAAQKLAKGLINYTKEAVSEFISQDKETQNSVNGIRSALTTLKISWGAAFAPIINAVAPLLQTLIGWLTSAANAVARFFAVLGGKNSYKKAIASNAALADSYGAAGSAAKEASKSVLGFDELNKLNDDSSSGGGGGGGGPSAADLVEESIDNDSLAARLALAVKDVLFNWDDLTAEDIAAKALAGLLGLGGMIIGGMIGGVPGAIIGLVAGLGLGVLLDSTIFNFDGELSKTELIKALIYAAGFAGGGIIGFLVGGPLGAMLGASLGLFLSFKLDNTIFDAEGNVRPDAFTNVLKKLFSWNPMILLGPGGSSIWVYQTLQMILSKIEFPPIQGFIDRVRAYFQPFIDDWKKRGSEDMNKVGFYIVAGIIEGCIRGIVDIGKKIYENVIKPIIDVFREGFQVNSPSKVTEEIGVYIIEGLWSGIEAKWNEFLSWMSGKWNAFKSWWQGLSLGSFPFRLPHLAVQWEELGANSIIHKLFGIPAIPHFSVQWYAKGGIVDGATLIGAGEQGKEAIIPLERNTEWIRKVALELLDAMESRFENIYSGQLPLMASGQVVPPNAYTRSGSLFSDADVSSIISAITGLNNSEDQKFDFDIHVYLDGREISSAVTRYQRQDDRTKGR